MTAQDSRDAMRAALTAAMKGRDRVAVEVLRSTIGAIENAESIAVQDGSLVAETPIAGARSGIGSTEATRRELSGDDVADVIRAEIEERRSAADQYDHSGHGERANTLRAEIAVLRPFVDGPLSAGRSDPA